MIIEESHSHIYSISLCPCWFTNSLMLICTDVVQFGLFHFQREKTTVIHDHTFPEHHLVGESNYEDVTPAAETKRWLWRSSSSLQHPVARELILKFLTFKSTFLAMFRTFSLLFFFFWNHTKWFCQMTEIGDMAVVVYCSACLVVCQQPRTCGGVVQQVDMAVATDVVVNKKEVKMCSSCGKQSPVSINTILILPETDKLRTNLFLHPLLF